MFQLVNGREDLSIEIQEYQVLHITNKLFTSRSSLVEKQKLEQKTSRILKTPQYSRFRRPLRETSPLSVWRTFISSSCITKTSPEDNS